LTKNFDCEYPNFGSETSCIEKITKNLVYSGLHSETYDPILLQF